MAAKLVTSEMCKNWDKQGKLEFLHQCRQTVAFDSISPLLGTADKGKVLCQAIYELLWNGIRGTLRKDSASSAIGEVLAIHQDMASVVLDVIGVVDTETLCNEGKTDERERFLAIVQDAEKYLSEGLLKERLEIDFLQDVGILKNKKNFHTKFIKIKTKLFYKQQKFNLFREESEGYAKLITELNQVIDPNMDPQQHLQVIKSLIGCFNLDPNRVLDIILETFENHPEQQTFLVQLLESYMSDSKSLCEVLGFKFSLYRDSGLVNSTEIANSDEGATQKEEDEGTPKSLYVLTALLLQHKVITVNDIYCWLVPDDQVIKKAGENDLKDAKEAVRRVNIVSTREKDKNDVPEEKENPMEKYRRNQKFGLCEALIQVGDWEHVCELCRHLPPFVVSSQPPIATALCSLIHGLIEPLYRVNSGLSSCIKGRKVPLPKGPLVPKPIKSVAEFNKQVVPMLLVLGPHLHRDPVLLCKILRIAKALLTKIVPTCGQLPNLGKENSESYFQILTLLEEVILPSLSLMDANCCIVEEIWNVVKFYPYQHRYRLYGMWKNESWANHPLLLNKKAESLNRIKSIMKRVSKENVKPIGRLLGKLTHSSPGILFDYILSQVQLYDNLIGPVVDSLKYLTSLSYDVLAFCVVEALAHPDKERTKHDGHSLSPWLQSLSSFCGSVFKKYNVELTGLLQYLANQLKAKKSLDLLILKEIVQKMAGIEASEDVTNDQLEAMSGGELLKAEAGYFSQVRNTKKSSQRLKEALSECDLALALCLLMAQQRNGVVYQETENSHLKLVGKLYDQCQDTLVQFGTFLATNWSMDDYAKRIPQISDLLAEYHIHADVAFCLARPLFAHAINSKFEEQRRSDKSHRANLSSAQKQQRYVDAVETIMAPIVESVRSLHSPKVWEDISPQFYTTFWSLTLYDLGVPSDAYQNQVQRIKQQGLQINDNKDMVASKRKKEQDRCNKLLENLQDEEKKQKDHVERVISRLKQEKDAWFISRSAKSAKNETVTQFLQLCLFPRCIFTASDAVYCAKFVHTVHSLKTPNFSTLICYDRIFCDITYTLTSCTENEANRYGRFLCAMLKTVMWWHSDKAVFEKECANYPGFVTKFRVSNQASEANDHVDYENYRHVCHKWHYKIAKAMVVCLESKDYVQIRNALIILIKILPHFPIITSLGQVIEKRIEKVRNEEKDKRHDLYALAISYNGQLKNKKPLLMPENKFHQIMDKSTGNSRAKQSDSSSNAANSTQAVQNNDKTSEKEKDKEKKTVTKSEASSKSTSRSTPNSQENAKSKEVTSVRTSEKERNNDKESKGHRDDNTENDRRTKDRIKIKEEKATEKVHTKDEKRVIAEDREASVISSGSGGSDRRRSQEPPEFERDVKRRKIESSNSKESKQRDTSDFTASPISLDFDKPSPADRKEKREQKKEKKREQKRERAEETVAPEVKRKKDDDRATFPRPTNGEPIEHRDKHHYQREKSPSHYREKDRQRDRDRSRDREARDKKYTFDARERNSRHKRSLT